MALLKFVKEDGVKFVSDSEEYASFIELIRADGWVQEGEDEEAPAPRRGRPKKED